MTEFASRVNHMKTTADVVKNLFSSMGDPSLISFSGGAPANEALPIDEIRDIAYDVLTKDKRGIEALKYGSIQGALDLREIIVNDLLKPKGIQEDSDNVLITSGGLETMNLVCQLYIEKGDYILVESPTFVHCVEIFDMFEAQCISCEMDEDGLIIKDVEEKINKYKPKMIYVIPTFQNPTGRTLSLDRRKALAELGSKYDVVILEDDPYRDIRYSGKDLLPIKVFDKTGNTILANSFSKIFSPGSRLGYTVADNEIIKKLCDIKSATNSHTGMISQVLCAEFFKRGYYTKHHEYICDLYRERRDVMVKCIKEFLPKNTKYTYPEGGLFTWIELSEGIDTTEMLKEATEVYKVAYVAGEGFFAERDEKGKNCMRVSFSAVPPEKIREGMKRLGDLIKKHYDNI